VYNFEVEDFHTYHVTGLGVLVHNKCTAEDAPTIIGSGHGNPLHEKAIDAKINEIAETGKAVEIYGNRSLNTAGLNGKQRPDVIVKNSDDTAEVWEFESPSQASGVPHQNLIDKIAEMQRNNPNVTFHGQVPWRDITK
jgi:hypothetical protein